MKRLGEMISQNCFGFWVNEKVFQKIAMFVFCVSLKKVWKMLENLIFRLLNLSETIFIVELKMQ